MCEGVQTDNAGEIARLDRETPRKKEESERERKKKKKKEKKILTKKFTETHTERLAA